VGIAIEWQLDDGLESSVAKLRWALIGAVAGSKTDARKRMFVHFSERHRPARIAGISISTR